LRYVRQPVSESASISGLGLKTENTVIEETESAAEETPFVLGRLDVIWIEATRAQGPAACGDHRFTTPTIGGTIESVHTSALQGLC
jgi:hypothetical protein